MSAPFRPLISLLDTRIGAHERVSRTGQLTYKMVE
jgi:hypothetical protein